MKLGIQTQWDSAEALRYAREIPGCYVMGINVVKAEWIVQIRAAGSKFIYRHHPNFDAIAGLRRWEDDPEAAASDAVGFLGRHLSDVLGQVDLIAGDNEFILGMGHGPSGRIALADRYMAAFIRECEAVLDKPVCIGNFNVGHWGPETVDWFPCTLTALQAQAARGRLASYLCWHEYNWPFLRDDEHWYTGKFLRAMPPILAKYPQVRAMLTEVGIDRAAKISGEHAGWRLADASFATAVEMYCGGQGLGWYNDVLNATAYVEAALIFGCGMGDWRAKGFDIMNSAEDTVVLSRIKQFPAAPLPVPPSGGDGMTIRVFNIDGIELFGDAALDLIKFHGVTVHEPLNMREGEWYRAVVKMEEREGPACFIYTVLDETGSPEVNRECAWAWADNMGDADEILGKNYPTDWQKQADLGFTNENGNMGPGFGQSGWWHKPNEPGPGRAWVRDPLSWSVLLTGIGMLDMTPHRTMYATWQMKQWQGEEVSPMNGELLAEVRAIKADVATIKVDVAKVRAIWEGTPPEPPIPPADTAFKGEYFNNTTLSGIPVLVRDDSNIYFIWNAGSPDPRITPDNFSVRWTAKKTFEAGIYKFTMRVDDGGRLYVDDVLLMDAWKVQAATTYTATKTMTAGQHPIRMEFFEAGGLAVAQLNWTKW